MLNLDACDAVLFDLDGVLTPTADIHQQAWHETINEWLQAHAPQQAPYTSDDYHRYVDGRPRIAGIETFFAGRRIAASSHEIGELADAKQTRFLALLAAGVEVYDGSLRLLDALAVTGVPLGVVTSSANGHAVLAAAGITDRFTIIVDAAVTKAQGLQGKPAPDPWLYAARELGVEPAHCAVVEDALAGVMSGAAGNFGLIIGVDRGVGAEAMRLAGAHVVVADLAELIPAIQPGDSGHGVPNLRRELLVPTEPELVR